MAYPNLVAEMRRTGLTNRDLAEVTEKSKDTITNWLNGTQWRKFEPAIFFQKSIRGSCEICAERII